MFFPSQRPNNVMPSQMRPPSNFMMHPSAMNTMPQSNSTPGILSRLLNASSGAGAANPGGGGLSGALNNVQQILKVVQSGAPLVQEYGPMIKNLPAMYKMMKAFKDMDNSGEKTDESADGESPDYLADDSIDWESSIVSSEIESESNDSPRSGNGESVPKLYI
ncbi:VrrA/YqfQ family protein [Virgibacillus sp. YIM 98842]|jgi:hypothetical protein|uniref:VrrA/YqfQ family protein n=1 Tax=Virgibacillus sp. YIM 98842 TaxID=2663533 RepID=UPI0013DB6A45|nr:VrrA/YqfQ family protein [Virgibacillus sp. YIM 98842]